MTMTRRERIIAVATVAAALLLGFDRFAWTPYMNRRADLESQRAMAAQQMSDAADIFARQRKLRTVWTDLQAGGLKSDASSAESQALRAIVDWSGSAGLTLTALKPDRGSQQGWFQVVGFRAVASGSMAGVARLLWTIDNSPIPMRVTDIQITPRKEATDDLSVQIGISTLSRLPKGAGVTTPKTGGSS